MFEIAYARLAIRRTWHPLRINALRRAKVHYFPKRGKQAVNPAENFNLFGVHGLFCRDAVSLAGPIFPPLASSLATARGINRMSEEEKRR
jgi:hypothetical protein